MRPSFSAHSSEATTIAPAPSLTPGALPAVWVASSPPIARSLASVSTRGVGADRLVGLDRVLALARLDRDADDLVGEPAGVGRLGGEPVRALGEAVHVGAGDLELVGDLARLVDHLLLGEGVGEAVVGHRVDRLDVAHPEAEAGAGQQVGRLAHRLHAAGHGDLGVAGADRLVGEADRAHARGADLVDRLRGDLLRDAALDLGLARGDLALAGLQDLAEDDLLDLLGVDAGALQRGLDRVAAEVGGVERGEGAAHLAEGRARGSEDDCAGHLAAFLFGLCRVSAREGPHGPAGTIARGADRAA